MARLRARPLHIIKKGLDKKRSVELARVVGRTVDFVKLTHIATAQGLLGRTEIPLQAKSNFLDKVILQELRLNPIGIGDVETIAHGAEKIVDLEREKQTALAGVFLDAKVDHLVGGCVDIAHSNGCGVVCVELDFPHLREGKGKATISRSQERVFVIRLGGRDRGEARHKLRRVGFMAVDVVGLGIQGKGEEPAQRQLC